MKRDFPQAPDELPADMAELVRRLAQLWATELTRPRPTREVLEHWDVLIEHWSCDPTLPLYIRKHARNRGCVLQHPSGRPVVPTDNSPAQWAFARAILGERPSLDDVRSLIAADRVPVAMVLTSDERKKAAYLCTLAKSVNPNAYGWKIAHIDAVGLSNRVDLGELPEDTIRAQFLRLMTPRNMFAIPRRYAGLGELPEFSDAIRTTPGPA